MTENKAYAISYVAIVLVSALIAKMAVLITGVSV